MKWISLPLILVAFAFAAPAIAAPPQTSSQDRTWLVGTHQDNLAEIKSGDLAAKSGHSEAVRNAGRMLAEDHAKLDAKLKPLAKKLGVKLPERPNAEQRDEMKTFESLSGMKFDETWTNDEANGHVKAIEQAESEIQNGSDPQVKQLAESALPVLKKHLDTLHAASTKLSGSRSP